MNSRSSLPSASTTCIRPSASAASVPGIGAMCQSLCAAVRVRIGSMATINAPFCALRGSAARGADASTARSRPKARRASRTGASPDPFRRGCRPGCSRCRILPRSCRSSSRDATYPARSRAGVPPRTTPWISPMLPVPKKGPDRLAAVLRDRVPSPAAILSSASSHEIRVNWPLPFGPTRRIGYRGGRANARSQVVGHLVAQRSARVGMVGIAARAIASPCPSRSRSSCTCRGSRADTHRGHDVSGSGVIAPPSVASRRPRPRLIVGRRVRISTVVFAIKWLTLSGSACSLLPSRIADRLGRGRSRT